MTRRAGKKPAKHSEAGALASLLSASIKREPSGTFVMLPFRIFEMVRFPKTKRFFCPQISDEQIFALLPQRAAELLKDLMELDSPTDRLSVFRELEAQSELAVEIRKKLQVHDLTAQFGFNPRKAEHVLRAGEGHGLEAVRWLAEVLKSPDSRTRKMLLFLLQPPKKGKLKRQEIVDRLEFAHIPVPHAKSPASFMSVIASAHEALRLGFPFRKEEKP